MPRLFRLRINTEGFAFDPTTGDSYVVNRSGAALLTALQNGQTENQLADTLIRQFEVPQQSAMRDVGDFMTRLRAIQLM